MARKAIIRLEASETPRFNAKPRPLTRRERKVLQKWLPEAIRKGWIRRSTAKHSSAILWVPKKNGELRMCIDYRLLNKLIKTRVYAPRSDRHLRQEIGGCTWFSKIDIKDAFYHLNLAEDSKWLTAFRTPMGMYEWNVLPMGLAPAPGEFQLYIEQVLAPVLGRGVTVHIDDILVHTKSKAECEHLTSVVHDLLRHENLVINTAKSVRLVDRIEFCGYIYGHGRIRPVSRASTLADWPEPRNPTELRAFLGTANCVRDHVHRYSTLAAPLYENTGLHWNWTRKHRQAFLTLKDKCQAQIDHHWHDPALSCRLTSDASLFGIAVIRSQNGKVTGMWSRSLTPAERNYPANERELLAVVEATKVWGTDLEVAPSILVETDSMINATNIKPNDTNRRINRWVAQLQAFPLVWKHKPGIHNEADAPSRRPDYV